MSGFEAPRDIAWTAKHRNTLIRVPFFRGEQTRIELRFPDPSANPYLTLALIMAAGLDGISRRTEPGPETADRSAGQVNERGSAVDEAADRLPYTLREAIAYMEQDDLVKDVLGQEFVRLYTNAKKAEWNEYMSQVSEWELEKYLYRT